MTRSMSNLEALSSQGIAAAGLLVEPTTVNMNSAIASNGPEQPQSTVSATEFAAAAAAASSARVRRRSRSRSLGRSEPPLPPPPLPPPSNREEGEVSNEQSPEEQASRAIEAVRASFPPETKRRLKQIIAEGLVRSDEFDLKALITLQALPPFLQIQVIDYLESEKVFLTNARTKSGFLVSACEKARSGSLDARGFFFKDPWRDHLMAIARPKPPQVDLVPEKDWLAQHGHEAARLFIDVSADKELGVPSLTLAINLNQSAETIKKRLAAIGVKMPIHKMRLKAADAGFLKDTKTLASYNLQSGSELQLVCKTRGGVALKRDQSDGFDPTHCDWAPLMGVTI